MKEKVIIVEEDQSVYEEEIEESEIPSLLEGGFVSAVLRLVEEGIEYATLSYNTEGSEPDVIWNVPHKKEEFMERCTKCGVELTENYHE